MKTLEFKIHTTSTQIQMLESWLDTLKHVWNRGLALLEWRQYYFRLQKCLEVSAQDIDHWKFQDIAPVPIRVIKQGESWVYCSDTQVKVRLDKTKSWDADNTEWRPCVRLVKAHWQTPPPITGYNAIDLRKPFAKSRWDSGDLPSVYLNDFIGLVLADAWKDYLDPKINAAKPRYKGARDRINTLPCASFKSLGELDGDRIKLPGFDWLHIPSLDRRLGNVIRKQQQRMLSTPLSYPDLKERLAEGDAYSQVADWLESESELPEPDEIEDKYLKKAIKQATKILDKGQNAVANLRTHAANRELESSISHLSKPGSFRICRKASGWYLQITVDARKGKGSPRQNTVGIDIGTELLYETSTGVRVKHEDFAALEQKIVVLQQKLAQKVYKSGKWLRLNNKINHLRERIKRAKRSHHHYHSTWQTDANSEIVVKELEVSETVGRPLPRPDGEGGYLPNSATKAHERNRQILSSGMGQFVGLLEQKAKDGDRVFERIKVSPQASPSEVLTVSQNRLAGVLTGEKPASEDGREANVARPGKRHGKGLRPTLPDHPKTQAPQLVSLAKTPQGRKGRKRKPRIERRVL